LLEKIYDCARGAALCTGTDVEWRSHETGFCEILPNPEIEAQTMKILDELSVPYDAVPHEGGSTDVGDVSRKCPTMYMSLAFTEKKIALHTKEFASMAGNENIIPAGISTGARALARMGLLILSDPAARKKIMLDFKCAQKM
jgi:metal-dependent amidase/aminoacylase/carboxypeptidase family protein